MSTQQIHHFRKTKPELGDRVRALRIDVPRTHTNMLALGRKLSLSQEALSRALARCNTQSQIDILLHRLDKLGWEEIGATDIKQDETIQEADTWFVQRNWTLPRALNDIAQEIALMSSNIDRVFVKAHDILLEGEFRAMLGQPCVSKRHQILEEEAVPLQKRCELLDLSTELRNRIYEFALPGVISDNKRTVYLFIDGENYDAIKHAREPGLLLTCRKIREEALALYYGAQEFVTLAYHIDETTSLLHLGRIGPILRNLTVYYYFSYGIDFDHGDVEVPLLHKGGVTVELRRKGDMFTIKALVDQEEFEELEDDHASVECCDRSAIAEIYEGCQDLVDAYKTSLGDKADEVAQEGEVEVVFLGVCEEIETSWKKRGALSGWIGP